MEPSGGTRATNCIVGVATPLLFATGLALAGWLSLWASSAWEARDESWLLTYGSLTFLVLALPVVLAGWYERWQVKRGLYAAARRRTRRR